MVILRFQCEYLHWPRITVSQAKGCGLSPWLPNFLPLCVCRGGGGLAICADYMYRNVVSVDSVVASIC